MGTFFFASALFILRLFLNPSDGVRAEETAIVVYFAYLIGDLIELFTGKPFFVKAIKALLPKDELKSDDGSDS